MDAVVVNYNVVNYKPSDAFDSSATADQRRLTSSAGLGETIDDLHEKEFKRLSEMDPPAVAKPGDESEVEVNTTAITLTKPNARPIQEPSDTGTTMIEPSRATLEAAASTLRAAGVEVELPEVEVANAPSASPSSSADDLDDDAKALYDAGTVGSLTELAEERDVDVESGDKKSDLARKLAEDGATPDELK